MPAQFLRFLVVSFCICIAIFLETQNITGEESTNQNSIKADSTAVDYTEDVKPILKQKCFSCHAASKQEGSLRVDTAVLMKQGGDSGSAIVAGNLEESLIWERVSTTDTDMRMPPEAEPLSPSQLEVIKKWILSGANAPTSEQPQIDPASHWAFQPLQSNGKNIGTASQAIDFYIEKKLKENSLTRSSPADHTTLIRRLFLDLHGLPPSIQQLNNWTEKLAANPQSKQELIDILLSSPRYGERWGQHWLDIVRYADTHGFEVNTPRENAWRYRDYVIESFNSDKPYPQFILEQLAGDVSGNDAATGFLVAAAVLLPGQIGKDEESKRLARQDSLDEIIVGTSGTFLGLTIGCARCHDHKFDPISQEDYYALQACFAGVDYGDRVIIDANRSTRLAQAKELTPQLIQLKSQLAKYQPQAFPGRTILIDDEDEKHTTILKEANGLGTNPEGNKQGYRDDPGSSIRVANLSQGKYTWWDNHFDEDVFTWNPQTEGSFQIWISWGVHGSGVHTRDARYIIDYDGDLKTQEDQQEIAQADQFYYANQTEGDSEKVPRWSGLQEAGTYEFTNNTRIVLRGGKTGTGITADVIVLQEAISDSSEAKTDSLPKLRPPINPKKNVEQFAPIKAQYVRFTTLETIDNNRHEPCLDELEVYSNQQGPKNLALATNGTVATSSGDYPPSDRHRLEHINDGKYGNGRSWISNQQGGGWVQLKLPLAFEINKIIWGRDRDSKLVDRLPVRYLIEASLDGKTWQRIANSQDRVSRGTPGNEQDYLKRNQPPELAKQITAITSKLSGLENQIKQLRKPTLVYGGKFRKPDVTHILNRGDPEQPGDVIGPAVPQILGKLNLPTESTESSTRVALATWISSPENPLTARVIVNRIWQYHFGTGIVETPSDFGHNGAKPSHPELLDWLASEFHANGGSIKQIHRLILMSKTYQQSSKINPQAQTVDAACQLLWRFPSRRLESEPIRDSMLNISGNLNLKMNGPGFNFFKTRGGLSGFPPQDKFGPNELRRMIYAHKIRMESVPVFGAFDCPDAGQAMPKRSQSTTAIQALNLFNSPFVIQQAEIFAKRIESEVGKNPDQQINHAFLLAYGRSPTKQELNEVLPIIKQHGLQTLCRVIFNSNEFLFLP